MRKSRGGKLQISVVPIALIGLLCIPAVWAADAMEVALPEITVRNTRPTTVVDNPSPQAQVSAAQIREINAINVEDSLKYVPSLFIRKRYPGDTNSIIATRTTGSVQSAESLVYVDGLLLSNLLGNSFAFPPRWSLVGTEEIDTVEVLYGPFSALLPGNSRGATILICTRRPERFEAHARVQGFIQPAFKQYATRDSYGGHQEQAVLGGRAGKLSWLLLANNLDSYSQPNNFATAAVPGVPVAGGTPVTGAVAYTDPTHLPRVILGATFMDHTVQNTGKIRLAYDLTRDTQIALTYALWRNDSYNNTQTYLRNASTGAPVWGGNVNINGARYNVGNTLATRDSNTENRLAGLTLDSRLSPDWRIELAGSVYTTPRDISRSPTTNTATAQPGAAGGAGDVTFGDNTGWKNLDARVIWKPLNGKAGHSVTLGYHYDQYHLESHQYNATDWRQEGSITTLSGSFSGVTRTDAVYAQDVWKFDPRWSLTLGWRHEYWQAFDGKLFTPALGANDYSDRSARFNSPKASLSWQATPDWVLRASLARAYRMPTVSELFQTETKSGATFISDAKLKPEKTLYADLSAEGVAAGGSLRVSLFQENVEDALYSQTDSSVTPNVTRVQNVDEIRVRGIEFAYEAQDVWLRGLNLNANLTYADSKILSNPANPASVGKSVPRIPDWRAAVFASYRLDEHWSGSLGVRYSGVQYGRLDNADTHHKAAGSLARFTVADLRLGYQFDKRVRASLGIDNLTDQKYFIGPYPVMQRTYHAELRFDY